MLNRLKTTFILIVFLWSQVSFSDCVKDVTSVIKGDIVKCDGYLFSPEKELKVRIMSEENKYFKQQIELLDKQINLITESMKIQESITSKEREKAELWRIRAEDSTKKLIESEDGRGRRDLLFVIGGVLLTLGAGYAASQFWSR